MSSARLPRSVFLSGAAAAVLSLAACEIGRAHV